MSVLLGLDLGEKRIGLAVTDEEGRMAFPLKTLDFKGLKYVVAEVNSVIEEYRIEKIVVGLPATLSGEIGLSGEKVTKLVDALKRFILVEWIFWDERLSSKESERILLEADLSRKRRKEVRDKLAAQRILQNYLDFQRTRESL